MKETEAASAATPGAGVAKTTAAAPVASAREKQVKRDKEIVSAFAAWELEELEMANRASERYARERADLESDLLRTRAREQEEAQRLHVEGWAAAFEATSETARASADQLAEAARLAEEESSRFQGIFEGSIASGLTDLVEGTVSVKDAFMDMADSIVQSLNRIAAQKIAENLFGGGGASGTGWIGDLVSGFFGGGMKGFAGGGAFGAGRPMVVGERGPEIIVPSSAGTVVPNSALGGSSNIVVNVPPITDRRTADQAAASVGIAVQRAMKRNQ
jgi:hypothetical protein